MPTHYERILSGGGVLRIFPLESKVLRNNPLGDPALRENPLLMPAGGGRGLPLVVILVGFTGFGRRVLNEALWNENLPERIARLTSEGGLPPAVYLWPSCETRIGGSQYLNSSATGRYEDYLHDELVPRVEAEFGCGGAGRRVVAGKSSGGYGALTLAMRHPGWAAAAAWHAGDMGFEFSYFRDFPAALNVWRRHGGPGKFLEALPGLASVGTPEIHALNTLAMAACYSPNPGTPLGFDLPLDPETGEPVPETIARWFEHDPLHMVEKPEFADGLRQLRCLYLDAGERDEFALQWGLRRFVKKLEALRIPHHAEFFDGGHFDMDFRYEQSLPRLLQALG